MVRHAYTYRSVEKDNIYATKIGTTNPDKMYIVSAHMDSSNFDNANQGFRFAPGDNDDAAGTALVLKVARVLAHHDIATETSVRFILWNNAETGLNGSRAYVRDRRQSEGSSWLGVIQHDQLLWDHGTPAAIGSPQNANADIDIEYAASSSYARASLELANVLNQANENGRLDDDISYPTQVTGRMCGLQIQCPFRTIVHP